MARDEPDPADRRPRPVRAVLLDALGTLLELEPPAPRLRRALRDRFGLRVSAAETRSAVEAEIAYYRAHHSDGRDRASLASLRRSCALALRGALPEAARELPVGELTEVLLEALRFRAFRDAPGALRRLRSEGMRLVVVSNWDVSLHDRLVETGLATWLDGAITSAELGVAKPAPALFAHALTLAGVPASDALHVGNTFQEDVVGARAAGIEPILLVRRRSGPPNAASGRGGAAREAGGRVRTITSLRELPGLAT